jgi:hypothetical protein
VVLVESYSWLSTIVAPAIPVGSTVHRRGEKFPNNFASEVDRRSGNGVIFARGGKPTLKATFDEKLNDTGHLGDKARHRDSFVISVRHHYVFGRTYMYYWNWNWRVGKVGAHRLRAHLPAHLRTGVGYCAPVVGGTPPHTVRYRVPTV